MTSEENNAYEELRKSFARLTASSQFIFGFIGFSMLVLLMFGLWIYLILIGLIWAGLMVALTFDAPYRFMIRIFRWFDLPKQLPSPGKFTVAFNFGALIFPAYLVYMGIRGLLSPDFGFQSPLLVVIKGILASR